MFFLKKSVVFVALAIVATVAFAATSSMSTFEYTNLSTQYTSVTTASVSLSPTHNNFTDVAPASAVVPGSGWATFYNDNACSVNGGEAVSISNNGCLAESGRGSIYIQPGESDQVVYSYSLVLTPPGVTNCNCQVQCIDSLVHGETNNFCYNLAGHAPATSFRFIQGGCGKNNCVVG